MGSLGAHGSGSTALCPLSAGGVGNKAAALKADGIVIFAIGIRSVSTSTLNLIASDPDASHVFQVATFRVARHLHVIQARVAVVAVVGQASQAAIVG